MFPSNRNWTIYIRENSTVPWRSTTITACPTVATCTAITTRTTTKRAFAPRRLNRTLGAFFRELDANTNTRHLTAAQGG